MGIIITLVHAIRCRGVPCVTRRLLFHGAGNVNKVLKGVGLVFNGDAVVYFQQLDDAGELGDDFVLDFQLLLHLLSGTA